MIFTDNFLPLSAAATEPLGGRLTPTGGATWAEPSGTATVVRNGSTGYAQLPAGAYAALLIGNGDVDVSVRGNRLAVRAQSATGKRYELRVASQQVSGGYYTSEDIYTRGYSFNCPVGAEYAYVSSCGNTLGSTGPFLQCSRARSERNYGVQGYSTATGPAYPNGSKCQVYHPYNYTVYNAQLWVVDAVGRESAVGPVIATSGMDTALLRLRAEGATVTAWVDGQQAAQVTDDDVVSRSRSRVMIGQPVGTYNYATFTADTLNSAPNAPQTAQPPTNRVVDRTLPVRLQWLFNDPDAGDLQSKFDLQYRLSGTTTWTTVSQETPNNYYDVAAGTFADLARYEWQVRTYDRAGVVGPYSAVDYFRAATPPDAPVWLIPTDGGQVPTQLFQVSWSASAQVALQVKIDSDTENVYDSGRVASAERGFTLQFPKNRVDRYLSVRVEAGELFSPWAVIKVSVFYTPPAITLLELTPVDEDGCILVQLRVPKPRGTQPTVIFQELYRVEGDGPEVLVAARLLGDALWIDWTPASGVNNRYRVIAYADNGTTSDSGLVDSSTVLPVSGQPSEYTARYLTNY